MEGGGRGRCFIALCKKGGRNAIKYSKGNCNLQQGLFDWKGNPLVVNLSGVAQGIMY